MTTAYTPESLWNVTKAVQVRRSASNAVKAAYAEDIQFTRIEIEDGKIWAATGYKSGIMLCRKTTGARREGEVS